MSENYMYWLCICTLLLFYVLKTSLPSSLLLFHSDFNVFCLVKKGAKTKTDQTVKRLTEN